MKSTMIFLVSLALSLYCVTTPKAAAQTAGMEYHVSVNGDDANDGSSSSMLKTISAAALKAQPGDVITVHAGVYREQIVPPRGGESDTKRIVYQAVPGEKVEIKGSEAVTGWEQVQGDTWKVSLPNTFFGGYNPYSDPIRGDWFEPKGRVHHTGAVYLDGHWLYEATKLDEVMAPSGTIPSWINQPGQEYLLNVAWLQAGNDKKIPATRFTAKNGTQNAPCSEGGECIGFILDGHWVKYEGVDFNENTELLKINAASASNGGIIEIRLDKPDGELLGTCSVPNTGGWQSWETFKVKIKPLKGPQTVYLVFKGAPPHKASENVQLWFAQVDDTNTTIWAQFTGVNPNEHLVEINVRRAVFYPDKPFINFITVRGFTLAQAATQWAPPTAEQIGLIGTHWSKGWIIENNTVSYSICSGIALGKYGDEYDNTSANTAEGYVKTIERALANGWNKDTIGHHIVRNNTISHCEQTGIVGSMGAAFSTVTGNTIHDIHVRKLFTGAEMAGIKFHAAIDTEIRGNHIYKTCLGLWLDWMAQGVHVSGNLFHDNGNDLFMEVDHGPFMITNNLFLSPHNLLTLSQGGAFVHNLFTGVINVNEFDARQTPFHKAHSTELAEMHDNPCGDDRYYNNVFTGRASLQAYEKARFPVMMDGNVFLRGAKPFRQEMEPILKPDFDPLLQLTGQSGVFHLEVNFDAGWAKERTRKCVTTELLGKAKIPDLPYETRDGAPLRMDMDYFGAKRNVENPFPGPFELSSGGKQTLTVWPAGTQK